jgi:phospholipase C
MTYVSPYVRFYNMFVLMLENHSFDNMFAMSGIPGIVAATTSNSNSYNGTSYPVKKGAPSSMPTDPGHEFQDVVEQLCGQGATFKSGSPYPPINNSGFAANYATTTTEGPVPAPGQIGAIMQCFDTPNQLPVMYQLATEFALCDHWFSSLPGPTWPNRFFVHGASSAGLDHSPSTGQIAKWESVSGFTYPKGSIYDALNRAKLKWRLYNDMSGPITGAVPQVTSLKGIQITDTNALSKFASDLQGPYPYAYTFIEPNYGNVANNSYVGGTSQHPMDGVSGGEQIVKSVYEAIRNSPHWENSLLIITYDEHGGFYDSVQPGVALPPNDGSSSEYNQFGFDFTRYGVRVPAIVVSPLIPKGTVDHMVYDHASVLATLERNFSMPALTQRDAKANDVGHLMSLTTPRTDCPTVLNSPAPTTALAPMAVAAAAPMTVATANQPLPETGNLPGFLAATLKADLEMAADSEKAKQQILDNFQQIKTIGDADAYMKAVLTRVNAVREQS